MNDRVSRAGGRTNHDVAEIAHDFNNVLSIIRGNATLLAEEIEEDGHVRELTDAILEASSQGAGLIRRLLVCAQPTERHVDPSPLDATVETVLRTVRPTLPDAVQLTARMSRSLRSVRLGAEDLKRVLTNLLLNASEALPEGGEIAVRTMFTGLEEDVAGTAPGLAPGEYGIIAVSDNGRGMTPEFAAKVFEPFVTTKRRSRPGGLGLAIVFGLVKEAGGYTEVETTEGKGATFRIYLPVA